MRIGIDVRSLQNDSQNRGIGTYTRGLIDGLLSVDKANDYTFFVFHNRPLPQFLKSEKFRRVKVKKVDYARRNLYWSAEQFLLPLVALKERLDIYHSPEYMVPVLAKCKKVITVHDFIYREFKEYSRRLSRFKRFKQNILFFLRDDKSLRRADKIISVSRHTRDKITEITGVKKEEISLVYEAAGDAFRPLDDRELFLRLRGKYGIRGDFLLYAGAVDWHKNVAGLISAFGGARRKDTSLVLAGIKNDPACLDSVLCLIRQLKLEKRVHILGHVAQEELAALYNMAKIVISVSFHEGFGLPALEAMSCGKPVIVSEDTAMAEVVGEGGVLVDPYDSEEISAAIDCLLADEGLRSALSARALARSKDFSWEKCARETLSVYKELWI